jgi:hypothetical protein
MNLEKKFTRAKAVQEYRQLYGNNDDLLTAFVDDFWNILEDECYPEIKNILLNKSRADLEKKMERKLSDAEALAIVKSYLDGVEFSFDFLED